MRVTKGRSVSIASLLGTVSVYAHRGEGLGKHFRAKISRADSQSACRQYRTFTTGEEYDEKMTCGSSSPYMVAHQL